MEGKSASALTNSVPKFARGLNILLVDHDTVSLMYLASLLEQYSFKVTTTELASVALSMIREQENRFKLVIANMNLHDMDRLSFLRVLLKKEIPIILMSSDTSLNVALKALAEGACYFLEKPIRLVDIKNVWQHAFFKRSRSATKESPKENVEGKVNHTSEESQGIIINEAGSVSRPAIGNASYENDQQHITMGPNGKNKQIGVQGSLIEENHVRESQNTCIEPMMTSESNTQGGTNMRGSNYSSGQINSISMKITEEEGAERKEKNSSSTDTKKRFLWTPELHLKFTAALSALGEKNSRPKTILKMMNVPNLTLRQVASHLQKFKAQVQRINDTGVTNLPAVSRSFGRSGRTGMAQSYETQSSLPSQVGYESSYSRNGGNTTQFAPNFMANPGLYAGHSVNHDPRNPNNYFEYAGLSGNSNPYLSTGTNGVQTQTNGEFQMMNRIRETNSIPYDVNMYGNGKGKQPVGFEGGSVQVSNLDLRNLSCITLDAASPYISANMFQFPNVTPDLSQGSYFTPEMAALISSHNQNHFPMECVPGPITSGNATIQENFPTGFTNESQQLEATAGHVPPASSSIQNEPLNEYAGLLKALEEEPEEFNAFGSEPNLGDIDRYCEWLRQTLSVNTTDAEQLDE